MRLWEVHSQQMGRSAADSEVAKQFQKKYGLTADGKVGPATYKKIQEVWTEKNPGKANQLGIVPINTYTPNHVVKFNSALKEIC
jgi:peptidoglycan hydrolase-like protein with peptidoglycan-binding domain